MSLDEALKIFMDLIDKTSSLSTSQLILIGSGACIFLALIMSKVTKKKTVPKAEKKDQGIGNSKQLYQKVVEYVNAGKIHDACTILEQLGRIDEAVGIYETTGMIVEAANLLIRSGSSGKAAWLAHKHGLYDLAVDTYIKMGDYEGAGNCYAMKQDWEHAIECFERCKDYQKEILCCIKLELYQQAGMACIAMKDYMEAINCFRMLVEKSEDISSIRLEPEAVELLEDYIKNVDGSCTELIDLVALSSDLSEIVFHYASINNLSVAINIALRSVINIGVILLDRSAVDQRFNDDICRNLAVIFREAGNIKVAAGFFKKIKGYQDAAEMYLKAGDKEQARECYTLGGIPIPKEAMDDSDVEYNEHSDTIVMGESASSISQEQEPVQDQTNDIQELGSTSENNSETSSESVSNTFSSISSSNDILKDLSSSISQTISEVSLNNNKVADSSTPTQDNQADNEWYKYRFFSKLDQDQIAIIESCLIKENASEGEVLIEKEKDPMGIFFIQSGTVLIDGEESTEIEFGDELIKGQTSPYSLSCKTEVSYKLLSKDTLLSFLQNDMFSSQIKSVFDDSSTQELEQKAS